MVQVMKKEGIFTKWTEQHTCVRPERHGIVGNGVFPTQDSATLK